MYMHMTYGMCVYVHVQHVSYMPTTCPLPITQVYAAMPGLRFTNGFVQTEVSK